jgi:signal transduction histidine kinase
MRVNRLLELCQAAEIETGRARRRMRAMLSDISHDVRTPLTSIVGYIDAMRDELSGQGRLNEEYLAIVREKAQKLFRYVESLFLLARLEAGEHPFQLERLDLAETLREALLSFYPVLEGRKLEVEAAIPEERCPVRGDRTSLMRVFGNLVTNAVEHGGEGGYLRIALRRESDAYAVQVRDRGPGIPAGAEERIFSRSFTTGGRGAGLGLAIVRELVGRHGGRVTAGNDPDGGAVFTVTLPADRP